MANPSDFVQSNKHLVAPVGHEEIIQPLCVYNDGRQSVSCWMLTDAEVEEVIKTRCVFVNIASGTGSQPPIYVWAGKLAEGLF